MIQNIILAILIIMIILLILTIIKKPLDVSDHNCAFKILPPKIKRLGKSKVATFNILVHKNYQYFINFPLLFKFYGNEPFKADIVVSYILPNENKKEIILKKIIEFVDETIEYEAYITDIIVNKIMIEIIIDKQKGKPIIGFEILENSTCDLIESYKLEIKF
jgi:hypothetical protein